MMIMRIDWQELATDDPQEAVRALCACAADRHLDGEWQNFPRHAGCFRRVQNQSAARASKIVPVAPIVANRANSPKARWGVIARSLPR